MAYIRRTWRGVMQTVARSRHRRAAWAAAAVLVLGGALGGAWDATARGEAADRRPAAFDGFATRGDLAIRQDDSLTLRDEARRKTLPVRVTWPREGGPYAVIVWSHGMGGSKDHYDPLVTHWARHGFVVIQPSHGDSLAQARANGRRRTILDLMGQWDQRPADIKLILDNPEQLVAQQPALKGKMDAERIGLGGHSFGAHTALLLAGATVHRPGRVGTMTFRDDRIDAFVMVSAQGTGLLLRRDSYAKVDRPTLFVTGTHDASPINNKPASWRLEPFRFSPPGERYLLYLDEAHHGFGGIAGPDIRYPGRGPDDADQVGMVRAVALAMWRAHLTDDAAARRWLNDSDVATGSAGKATLRQRAAGEPVMPSGR